MKRSRAMPGWGLPASVGVHLLVIVLLTFGLPVDFLETEEEKAIEIDLVPPPQQEAEAEPPPPAAKTADAEPSPPPPGAELPQQVARESVINPVFQFGEQDGGPRQSPEGNSAEDGAKSPDPAEPATEAQSAARTGQEEQPEGEAQRAEAEEKSSAEPPVLAAKEADSLAALVEEPPKPEARPKTASTPRKATKLQKARTLFSRSVTNNPIATTAMRNMPRDIRAGRLCVTELREQLLNAWPPYAPDLLPTERLRNGTVLDARGAAFRQNGEWYDLDYRCEVDADAMKVVSFAYSVGDKLPRSEWMRRGLPLR